MVIHAYSDDYLTSAQRILGDMLDFAVNTYDMDIDKFFEMFLVSNVSRQFEIGNPTYVAGKTGCELVKEVIRDSGLVMEEYPDEMYLDKSPEYLEWLGIGILSVVSRKNIFTHLQGGINDGNSKYV